MTKASWFSITVLAIAVVTGGTILWLRQSSKRPSLAPLCVFGAGALAVVGAAVLFGYPSTTLGLSGLILWVGGGLREEYLDARERQSDVDCSAATPQEGAGPR